MAEKELPPSEEITLKYERGCLIVKCPKREYIKKLVFMDDTVKQHVWYIMLQLSRLLDNKSMSISMLCTYDYGEYMYTTYRTNIHLSYNSATRQLSIHTGKYNKSITFTYDESKHKHVIESIFNDFYFTAGYMFDPTNKFKPTNYVGRTSLRHSNLYITVL